MHSIKKVPCHFSHRPRFHLQKEVLNLNSTTSGNENERRGLQTFSVRSDADHRRGVCGRTSRARPWFPSSTAHRWISDNKPRVPWRCFAWWRKFASYVLLPSRGYAYRRRRISDDPTTEWVERLVSRNLRLHQLNGTAIDLDQTSSPLTIGDSPRRLLAAEALDGLHRLRRATTLAM